MAEKCPWCGKFASKWSRNPRQSEWDMMQGGPEYICERCFDALAALTTKEN